MKYLKGVFARIRNEEGTSVIIALSLVAIITIFALGVSSVIVSSIRQTANVQQANKAYFAAEGGIERGLYELLLHGAGYEKEETPENYIPAGYWCQRKETRTAGPGPVLLCSEIKEEIDLDNYLCSKEVGKDQELLNPVSCSVVAAKVDWKIRGRAPFGLTFDGLYAVPVPGTGTAGTECDLLEAITTQDDLKRYLDETENSDLENYIEPKDHACNWNKIKPGEIAVIPLYVEEEDGTVNRIFDDAGLGGNELEIKFRTPCVSGEDVCRNDTVDRYELDQAGEPLGDIIVNWIIEDKESDKYLRMLDRSPVEYSPTFDSRITEGRINSLGIVDQSKVGKNQDNIEKFIHQFFSDNPDLQKPVLKFSVIHSLDRAYEEGFVPYLEYQVLVNTTEPLADAFETITAEGYSGTFKQTLEVKQPQEVEVIQYVIQQ